MATVTAPGMRRSLIGMALDAISSRAKARGRPSRVAAMLREHMLTVAAMAAVNVGLFHDGVVTGCIALGVSLLVLDFKIQG